METSTLIPKVLSPWLEKKACPVVYNKCIFLLGKQLLSLLAQWAEYRQVIL